MFCGFPRPSQDRDAGRDRISTRSWLRIALLLPLMLLPGLAGCQSTAKGRAHPRFATAVSPTAAVVVLPMDVEVSELSAGGIQERRDEWEAQVTENVSRAIGEQFGFRVASADTAVADPALGQEIKEVHALFRAITGNEFLHRHYGPAQLDSLNGPLRYQIGSMDALSRATGSDVMLLVFLRDDYATGGRKTLFVLGQIVGIPVRPGLTLSGAALVDRDGVVLWMNRLLDTSGDLRTPADAASTVRRLLAGVPVTAPALPLL